MTEESRETPNSIRIRSGQASDLDLLQAIERECFGASGLPLAQFRWLLESQGENPSFVVRLAVETGLDGENVMGFICWKIRNDPESPALEILDLSVGKNFRGERIEHVLVEEALREAAAGKAIGVCVNVPQANPFAGAFYSELGFTRAQSVDRYYQDGSGMDVMIRRVR